MAGRAAPVATWRCDRCGFDTSDGFVREAHLAWHRGQDARTGTPYSDPVRSDRIDGIRVLSFEVEGIERPGRVHAHPAHDGTTRMIVAFNAPAPREELYGADGAPKRSTHWSGLPTMYLYVSGFEEALALAREIGAAHRAGNVDAYVGRWQREHAQKTVTP